MVQEVTRSKVRVIDSLWTFFIALAVVGPLALPLLWRNPRFKVRTKLYGSVVVVAFTLFLVWVLGAFLDSTMQQMKELQELMK